MLNPVIVFLLFYDFFSLSEFFFLFIRIVGTKFFVGHVWENKNFATGFSEMNYFNAWIFKCCCHGCHSLWFLIIMSFFGGVTAVVFFPPAGLQLTFPRRRVPSL